MELTGTGSITVARPIRPRVPGERSIISKWADRIRQLVGRGAGFADVISGHGWTDPRWWSDNPDDWPCVATESDALGIPAFGRGLDLIAGTVADVDLVAYRYDKAAQIDVRLDPQPSVLRDPDPLTTPWNYLYSAVNDLVLYGNHFAFYGDVGADGWPMSLEPIDCTTVDLGVESETGLIVWRVNGEVVPYGGLFHVSSGNRSGYLLGRGVISQYREALSGILEVDRHAGRYFRRGGLPSAVIQVDDSDLTQVQADSIKEKYVETVGSGRGRKPMVIPGHYTFTPIVSDAERQQLVEARTWDASIAAMILGIPPHYLGLQGPSMTYSNVETADIAFVRDTVARWARPVESAVTKWLLPNGQRAKFDWTQRLRSDSKTRAEVVGAEIQSGVLTVNEGRQMINRPPLADAERPKTPPQLLPFTGEQDDQEEPVVENDRTPVPEVAK